MIHTLEMHMDMGKYDVELLRTIFDGFITSILEVCLYNYMKCNVSDLIML